MKKHPAREEEYHGNAVPKSRGNGLFSEVRASNASSRSSSIKTEKHLLDLEIKKSLMT